MTYAHVCVIALEQQGENVKKNERGRNEMQTIYISSSLFPSSTHSLNCSIMKEVISFDNVSNQCAVKE